MVAGDQSARVLTRQHFTLSCVVPALDEERGIQAFLHALHQTVASLTPTVELVVINDGSRDRTREQVLAMQLPIRYLELSRNFGKEFAIQAGLDVARGDCVLVIDADFQHPLELIPAMIDRWRSGVDVVYGVRRARDSEPRWRRAATKFFYWLMRENRSFDIPADAGDFRLMDARAVKALKLLPERNRYMKGLYAWVGFRAEPMEFDCVGRPDRSGSRFNATKLFELAMTGLTAFSKRPLRLLAMAGFFVSGIAMLYGGFIVAECLLFGQAIPGFTTLAAAIFFLSGLQLVAFGVLGEYIGRIYEEVKQRPLYVTALDIDRTSMRDVAAREAQTAPVVGAFVATS